jgi:urease accessory protein
MNCGNSDKESRVALVENPQSVAPDTKPAVAAQAAGWQGSLALDLACRRGGTVPVTQRTQAPLKLQRPFYPEGPEVCHSTIVHTAGGLVGGDQLTQAVHLGAQSQGLITTAAAAKVYRCPGAAAQLHSQIRLEADAYLEWLPQPTIVFNGSQYRQTTRVDLAPGALWWGWDLLRFGRSARGERFEQGEVRSHLEVWQQGRPLWLDRQQLMGGSAALTSPHGLAQQPVVGSFALVGQAVPPDWAHDARALWQGEPTEIGVTRLAEGLLCRYRGASTAAAQGWFVAIWQQLRPKVRSRPACIPRVWGV